MSETGVRSAESCPFLTLPVTAGIGGEDEATELDWPN